MKKKKRPKPKTTKKTKTRNWVPIGTVQKLVIVRDDGTERVIEGPHLLMEDRP